MFADECRKQKVLFAIADLAALALAFAIALILQRSGRRNPGSS